MELGDIGACAGILSLAIVVWQIVRSKLKGARERQAEADRRLADLLEILHRAGSNQGGRADIGFYSAEILAEARHVSAWMSALGAHIIVLLSIVTVLLAVTMCAEMTLATAFLPISVPIKNFDRIEYIACASWSAGVLAFVWITLAHRKQECWIEAFSRRVRPIWFEAISKRSE